MSSMEPYEPSPMEPYEPYGSMGFSQGPIESQKGAQNDGSVHRFSRVVFKTMARRIVL